MNILSPTYQQPKYALTVTLNPAIDRYAETGSLTPGGLNRIQVTGIYPGGKGINVAKTLAGFKADVVATGFTAGNNGIMLHRQVEALSIRQYFCNIAGETRTNIKLLDKSTNLVTELNEPGFCVTPHDVDRFLDTLDSLLENAYILYLSGSIPQGMSADIYRICIEHAKKKNVTTLLDADGNVFTNGLSATPDIVKPNVHELNKYIGRELQSIHEIRDAAHDIIDLGVRLVIVSMGKDGAFVTDGASNFHAIPPVLDATGTVGAGDSMAAVAGWAYARHTMSAGEIARFAVAAGSATAIKPGSDVCRIEEVQAMLEKVTLKKVI